MVLKEWEDLGDESYRDLNIYDCVHNLNVNSAKAENDEKNSVVMCDNDHETQCYGSV